MDPNRPPQDPNAPNRPPQNPNAPNHPPPDSNAPNQEAPARSAPDRPPPDRYAPERSAPDRSASERSAPDRSVPERSAPDRFAPDRFAPERSAPERSAPDRSAPERSAPDRPAPEQFAPADQRDHSDRRDRSDRHRADRDRSDRSDHRPTHGVPKTLPPLPPPPPPPPGPSHETAMVFEPDQGSWLKCFYNRETGEILYRTPKSWVLILSYSAMYLIFLSTFTLVSLYISLTIIKKTTDFNAFDTTSDEYLTYSDPGIGLTGSPTSEDNVPLIWYKDGEKDGYEKYVKAIDKFLWSNRRRREVSSLGPCGQYPYGYGEKPCIIIRINKKFNWAGKPLNFNSTIAKSAPAEVQAWMRADNTKLWLQCNGYHSYDKEHIGKFRYYPDPPGFDASKFPLDAHQQSPLVAVQISEFTIGISLAIECKLWYDAGPSTFEFVLYVAPDDKIAVRSVNV